MDDLWENTPERRAIAEKALSQFLARSVEKGAEGTELIRPPEDVTALIYFFWDEAHAAQAWPDFEGAILQTWRCCGRLKTVIVTNSNHACVKEFAGRFPNVEIQIETRLVPGDINSMSIDCNSRLYTRFETRYVLIVQNDGFPLRPGLEEWTKRGYDFIGAPYCRPNWYGGILSFLLNYCPSNGGFSLRTKRMCQLAAKLWERGGYANRPWATAEMSEDLFYTTTLPRQGIHWWTKRRQAPSISAHRFSYDPGFGPKYLLKKLPFGFHTARAFEMLSRRFEIPGFDAGIDENGLK